MNASDTPNPGTAPPRPGYYTTKLGRFGPLILIGTLSWSVPAGAFGTLSQALFAELNAADKIKMAALAGTIASISGAVAVVIGGLASDRTRSRFGRRKPWLVAGSAFSALAMAAVPFTDSFAVIVLLISCQQIGCNVLVAGLSALLPDHVHKNLLGRASALSGLGNLLGGALGGLVAAGFIAIPRIGLAVTPWTMVLAAIALCWALPTIPSQGEPRETASLIGLAKSLRPPGDKDFWLVFAGRVCFLLGLLTTFAYQLYILTDYFHTDQATTRQMVALAGILLAAGAGVFAVVMGPLSDRVGRRKPFVIGAGIVGAAGVALLLTSHNVMVFPISISALSMAYGTFISVDQAMMVQVLPNQANAARDLGFLTVANTAPGILAPGVAGLLVTMAGYPAVFVGGLVLTALSGVFLINVKRVR
ncbi:MAG: MFS transporter [Bifidobacteriaceae bacterium]|nr:MFS transporter [Bifidobacteriaceae bacterium]